MCILLRNLLLSVASVQKYWFTGYASLDSSSSKWHGNYSSFSARHVSCDLRFNVDDACVDMYVVCMYVCIRLACLLKITRHEPPPISADYTRRIDRRWYRSADAERVGFANWIPFSIKISGSMLAISASLTESTIPLGSKRSDRYRAALFARGATF